MAVGKTLDFGMLRPVTAAGVVSRDERGGRIPQEVRVADFRIQAIVGHHHNKTAFGQRRRRESVMGDLLKSCCEPKPGLDASDPSAAARSGATPSPALPTNGGNWRVEAER